MRETVSNHIECIHTPASELWPASKPFRPYLNISLFTKILSAVSGDVSRSKSGKRKATHSPLKNRSSKRTRTSEGSLALDEESSGEGSSSDGGATPVGAYPTIQVEENQSTGEETSPIFRHTAEIQFVKQYLDGTAPVCQEVETRKVWEVEDQTLQEAVFELGNSVSSPEIIDLGEIQFAEYEGRVVGVSYDPGYHLTGHEWLFLVPALSIDAESNDFHSPAVDLLVACRTLQLAGKAHINARLKIVVQPNGSLNSNSENLYCTLRLEFTISLVLSAVLDFTVPKKMTKGAITALEDANRRVCRVAFGFDEISSTSVKKPVTVSSFYTIMGPAPVISSDELAAIQPDALKPTLLPFQCRSVAWLLEKEGMAVKPDGSIAQNISYNGFSFWKEVQVGDHTWYMNRLSGILIDRKPDLPTIYGGMLAEEPGLGKTLETIALILLNPAPPEWNPSLIRWDDIARLDIKAVKTSLIVTPPSLVSQWKEELAIHAPTLKVLFYDGWTKVKVPILKNEMELDRLSKLRLDDRPKKKRQRIKGKGKARAAPADDMDVDENSDGIVSRDEDGERLEWCDYLHQFDIVITTYTVLRSEIYVARPAPNRPRREEAMYSVSGRARSPLVMVEWKRVVMDEVQMVGGGKAADMVSLIPRLSSLAVSGTPAKAQMSDLIHVLKFLRIDQLVGSLRLWNRLLKPGFSEEFTAFLRHYGIRTAKSSVTSELTIPQQTRYLVGIELGKVERHVYDQAVEAVLLELGLDARGVAASSGWRVNSNLLRSSIRRLRGICTHPQVGQLQRKGDGLYKAGALKTMDAVLQLMRDQNWRNLMEDWRTRIHTLIRSAQLIQSDDTERNRYQHALQSLQLAEVDAQKHLEQIKDVLAKHDTKGRALKEEATLLRRELANTEIAASDEKGKGKEREMPSMGDGDDGDGDEDPEEKGLPKTPAGEEHRTKRMAIRQRLREGTLTLHRVKFLQGDVHHVLGNSVEEAKTYQVAEQLRRELLKVTEEEAKKAVLTLSDNATQKKLNANKLTIDLPFLEPSGIRSTDLMEEVNALLEEVFNPQAALLWKWRTHIMGLLTQSLTPGEDEADGQEYQRTLDDQGEAETYLQAYAALLADRREALVNERTLLAAHDVREKKLRQTQAAMKAIATAEEHEVLEELEGLDFQPEHEVLHKDLSTQRKDILLKLNGRAIKSILIDLNVVHAKIFPDTHPEKLIVKDAIDSIRRLTATQNALHDKLEADLALLRKAFNQRILYFRQLQEISDSVAEVVWEGESIAAALAVCQAEKKELDAKINTTRARQRYLENLAENKDVEHDESDDKTCILCRCDFVRGFITQCAHVFCELCMKAWLMRKEGKTCPVCRVPVDAATVQRFTVNAAEIEAPPQPVAGEPAPQSRRKITYNRINSSLVEDIQNMETYGDFGTKIQTLVRHLVYLKLTDLGAKSIIFSAWADSLHIVEVALRANGIKTLRIDQKSKGEHATQTFRKDPEILVLLLHGERENAGLNITCASRVFLLESVVHHSFEIQAIARIDRLGQTRPTEVYCYYAEDTVERNILDLAARKGLSLYTKDNAIGTVSVSSFANDDEQVIEDPDKRKAGQKGDFIYKIDDMLAILFPHMFEELDYLLPPSEDAPRIDASGDGDLDIQMANVDTEHKPTSQLVPPRVQINAVAGPSRLT